MPGSRSLRRGVAGLLIVLLGVSVGLALRARGGNDSRRLTAPAASPRRSPSAGTHANAPSPQPSQAAPAVDAAALTRCLTSGGPPDLGRSSGSPTSLDGQIKQIYKQVQALRELPAKSPVAPELLSPARFKHKVARLSANSYSAAQAGRDERLLATLGAIPAGSDLRAITKKTLSSQVIGFYAPRTKRLVVRAAGEGLSGLAKITLAHELEHALADQHFGLPKGDQSSSADASEARLALIEGDATLTMERYGLAALSFTDQLAMLEDPTISKGQDQLADIPYYLQQQLTFPYLRGLELACHLYAHGGWTAIDHAYRQPPTTTAQVLWPRRYTSHVAPHAPPPVGSPPVEWSRAERQSFGAANLEWLFEAPGNDTARALTDPLGRVSSWRGGAVELFTNGAESAVGLSLATGRGNELCKSLADWYKATQPGATSKPLGGGRSGFLGHDQNAVISCGQDFVKVGIAPTLKVARALAGR